MSTNSLYQWIFKSPKPTEEKPVQKAELIGNTNAVSVQDYSDVVTKAGDKALHISGSAFDTVKVIGEKSNYEFINKGAIVENLEKVDDTYYFENKEFRVRDLGEVPE